MIVDPGHEFGRVKAYSDMATLVAGQFGIEPSLILALGYRESWLGWSPGYEPKGPCGWGDNGNAWGLFQIDKRFHGMFVHSLDAQDAEKQMFYALKLLTDNKDCFSRAFPNEGQDTLIRLSLAAYNAGYYGALHGFQSSGDPDHMTTGKDYGKWILNFKNRIDTHQLQGEAAVNIA
jgi:soluble lytic murein transglycosylase-like protein